MSRGLESVPQRIAIDVDEVVADLHGPWIEWINRRYGTDWDRRRGFEYWDEPLDLFGPEVFSFVSPEVYEQDIVKPYRWAFSVSCTIRNWNRKIVWATSCINGTASAKLAWLVRHSLLQPGDLWWPVGKNLPAPDKSTVPADVLVDDGLHSLEKFPGIGILVARPHNQNEPHPYPGITIRDIEELPGALLTLGQEIAVVKDTL